MQRAQQPVGLKYGFLFKCSQTLKLWRTTWFVLGADELMYYKRGALTPKVISLKENPVSILAADVEDSKRAHSFKLATPSSRTLILAAESSDLVDEWIAAIRAVAALYGPPPEAAMNAAPTKKLTDDQKEMLQVTIDLAVATGKLIPEAAQSSTPGLYAKGILDSLSTSILMSATTARVVVYKPKVQSGFQRFTSSLLDAQAQIIKYKRVVTIAQKRNGKGKGKEVSKSLDAVTASLTTLINLLSKSITKWAADHLDPDLNKVEEEVKSGEEEEEAEEEPIEDKDAANSPYVSPFFVNPATSPPPCKKTWELMVEECNNLIKNMENLLNAKDTGLLKLPSPIIIDQAKQFMVLSQQYHQAPRVTASPSGVFKPALPDDQFSLTKQQLLGSTSSIDYHAANIGLLSTDHVPPQTSDIISHAHSISTAISKLPSAIIKHRAKTLVTVIETIGSFSFSLSKLISDMVEHETFLRDPDRGRHTLHDEVHAVQYIALHMLALCPALLASDFRTPHDILHLTDSAKLLALGVTNTLESIRFQFTPSKRKRASPRKLASELTDAATGSMVFWFGLVGQEASMHLEA